MSEEEVTHINIPEANLTPVKLITINNIKYRCQQEEEDEEEERQQQQSQQQQQQHSRQSSTPQPSSSRQPSRLSQAPPQSRQSLPPQSRQNTPAPTQSRQNTPAPSQSRLSNAASASHHSIVQSASRSSVGPNHSTYEEETHTIEHSVSSNGEPSDAGKNRLDIKSYDYLLHARFIFPTHLSLI
jgi:hypothetical protein